MCCDHQWEALDIFREECKALEYNKKKLQTLSKVIVVRKTTTEVSNEWCTHSGDTCGFAKGFAKIWYLHKWVKEVQAGVFKSKTEAKTFRKHCCNVVFKQIWQQLMNKMKEDHQQTVEEKDNQINAIKYENVALQAHRDEQVEQLQCQDTIIYLRACYVDHARDSGRDNIIIIIRKYKGSTNDNFHDLSYYVTKIQRRKRCRGGKPREGGGGGRGPLPSLFAK